MQDLWHVGMNTPQLISNVAKSFDMIVTPERWCNVPRKIGSHLAVVLLELFKHVPMLYMADLTTDFAATATASGFCSNALRLVCGELHVLWSRYSKKIQVY